jgi:hypothetical protein
LEHPSELHLTKLAFPKENNLSTLTKITLASWKIWTKATHLNNDSEFEVYTTDSTAAVRWTIFWVDKTNANKTDIQVLEWEVGVYEAKIEKDETTWKIDLEVIEDEIYEIDLETPTKTITAWESISIVEATQTKPSIEIIEETQKLQIEDTIKYTLIETIDSKLSVYTNDPRGAETLANNVIDDEVRGKVCTPSSTENDWFITSITCDTSNNELIAYSCSDSENQILNADNTACIDRPTITCDWTAIGNYKIIEDDENFVATRQLCKADGTLATKEFLRCTDDSLYQQVWDELKCELKSTWPTLYASVEFNNVWNWYWDLIKTDGSTYSTPTQQSVIDWNSKELPNYCDNNNSNENNSYCVNWNDNIKWVFMDNDNYDDFLKYTFPTNDKLDWDFRIEMRVRVPNEHHDKHYLIHSNNYIKLWIEDWILYFNDDEDHWGFWWLTLTKWNFETIHLIKEGNNIYVQKWTYDEDTKINTNQTILNEISEIIIWALKIWPNYYWQLDDIIDYIKIYK